MTASLVGASLQHLERVSCIWGPASWTYVHACTQRIVDAFECTFDLTHQANLYLDSRAQLIRPVASVSGNDHWRDIWLITDSVWSQLQEECEIINNGRTWTPCEYRTYASMTFGKKGATRVAMPFSLLRNSPSH